MMTKQTWLFLALGLQLFSILLWGQEKIDFCKNFPEVKIENGYIITDGIPPGMGEEEQLWFKKIAVESGFCESENDIVFSNDKIKFKLKPFGCCCKPQNLE